MVTLEPNQPGLPCIAIIDEEMPQSPPEIGEFSPKFSARAVVRLSNHSEGRSSLGGNYRANATDQLIVEEVVSIAQRWGPEDFSNGQAFAPSFS